MSHVDERTKTTKLVVAFRNFTKAPKNSISDDEVFENLFPFSASNGIKFRIVGSSSVVCSSDFHEHRLKLPDAIIPSARTFNCNILTPYGLSVKVPLTAYCPLHMSRLYKNVSHFRSSIQKI